MTVTALHPERATESRFYVWMAGAVALVAFGGFMPTYWLQAPVGGFRGSVLVHIHALLFSAWPLLFLWQSHLAAAGRLQRHRAWGVAGVSLATAMAVVGLATAHQRLLNGLAAGYGDPSRAFLIVQVLGLAVFVGFFVAAVANVSRPDWHKRLMLAASVSLLQAPLARIPFLLIHGMGPGISPGAFSPPPVLFTTAPSMLTNLFLVVGLVRDVRTRGRPHPAYPIALAVNAGVILLRVPLSHTLAWLGFADAFARFAT